jgi:hypothetical protein
MSAETEIGFDLDEETVELFDAILLAVTQDEQVSEEFNKLKFIRSLKNNYDSSPGPIRQMIQKLAKIERDQSHMLAEHAKSRMDMRRAVEDMTLLAKTIRDAAFIDDRNAKYEKLQALEGLEFRRKTYSWNQK